MADPAPRLTAALHELSSRAGACTARVVDGRTGTVVAAAGDAATGSDDPAAVVALLREAIAFGAGGLDDVVVTTDRSVHVLRAAVVAGVFVHLRLDLDRADTARARRALADPAFHEAVRWAVTPAPVRSAAALTFGPARTAAVGSVDPAEAAVAPAPPPAPAAPTRQRPASREISAPESPTPALPPAPAPSPASVTALPLPPSGGPDGVDARAEGPSDASAPRSAVSPSAPAAATDLFAVAGSSAAADPADPVLASGTVTPIGAAPVVATDVFAAAGRSGTAEPSDGVASDAGTPSGAVPIEATVPSGPVLRAVEVPRPRSVAPAVPAPRTAPPRQQPALAGLAVDRARTGDGARAAVALAELSRPGAPGFVLPRRRSAGGMRSVPAPRPGSTAGLPERSWARDLDTLRRLADGLRSLS